MSADRKLVPDNVTLTEEGGGAEQIGAQVWGKPPFSTSRNEDNKTGERKETAR